METRTLGGDGPALSVIGIGCNNFGMTIDADATRDVVRAALDVGITHFDTAEMYGGGQSELWLGEALGTHRDEVVIASKFQPRPAEPAPPSGTPPAPGALRARIVEGCEISLQRLGTDRIDLYYQHYPDTDAPVDEALEALDDLVRQGKVLHVASSNVDAGQLDEAAVVARDRGLTRFVGTQIEWNLLERAVEAEVVPAARRNQVGIVPYFPLASGMLTGKYRRGEDYPEGSRFTKMGGYFARIATDENFARVEELTELATARGHSVLELAVAWLAAQEGVTSVITGATSADQVRANAAAAEWTLDTEDLAAIG
jgi:aryl-alcohol dehydrogenase-like predicted oxidoreductase